MYRLLHLAVSTSIMLILFSSCHTDEEIFEIKKEDAMIGARFALNDGKCDKALAYLTPYWDNNDADFLTLVSSSYICKSDFSLLDFYVNDISKISAPEVFRSFATFEVADSMTSSEDESYINLWYALDVLLNAGIPDSTTSPNVANRAQYLTSDEADNINLQLFYVISILLGKFFHFYGDADSTGTKGAGTDNDCLYTYDTTLSVSGYADLGTVLDATIGGGVGDAGSCTSAGTGHTSFNNPAKRVRRLCEGVVLVNNFFDVFTEVASVFTGGELSDVTDALNLLELIEPILTTADANAGGLLDIYNMDDCIEANTDVTDDSYLQIYYAFVMERLYR
ncbi:MAG: hypothetical protein H6622_14300 [Halobacteriovoraceae bacterium]|nr:hypothetical protein [Halobacteriovoraceae bacterium]